MPNSRDLPHFDFDTQFEIAKTKITAYFELCRDIAARFAAQLTAQRRQEEAGQRPPSRRIKAGKICCLLANDIGRSYAFVNQCKVSARAFSKRAVDEILTACEAARHVPTQEFFIALSRIPTELRPGWIEAAVKGRLTASKIKEESKREYGVRSNGGRQPRRPVSLDETISKFASACSHLHAIFERLSEVQVGVVSPPLGVNFQVPRAVMTNVADCREALDSLRAELTRATPRPARGRGAAATAA